MYGMITIIFFCPSLFYFSFILLSPFCCFVFLCDGQWWANGDYFHDNRGREPCKIWPTTTILDSNSVVWADTGISYWSASCVHSQWLGVIRRGQRLCNSTHVNWPCQGEFCIEYCMVLSKTLTWAKNAPRLDGVSEVAGGGQYGLLHVYCICLQYRDIAPDSSMCSVLPELSINLVHGEE